MCSRLFSRWVTALSMSARSRWRVRGFARVFAATDFRVAATAFARPCRTRRSWPSAHCPVAAGLRVVADRGDLLLVPVDEEDALADPLRVAAVGLVERLPDHRGDVAGDGGRYPFIARLRV